MGSDVGDTAQTLAAALHEMGKTELRLLRVSRFYATPCFPAGAGPDYVNACAAVDCPGSADTVLTVLHSVEAVFGRRRTQRWASRSLDLDLLSAGQQILPSAETQARWRALDSAAQQRETPQELILPHPRLQERGFVLKPLADIAADWQHPALGITVAQMLAALPIEALDGIRPL